MATNDDPSRNFVSLEIAIRRESLATSASFYRAAPGELSAILTVGLRSLLPNCRIVRHSTRIRARPGCRGCEGNRLISAPLFLGGFVRRYCELNRSGSFAANPTTTECR